MIIDASIKEEIAEAKKKMENLFGKSKGVALKIFFLLDFFLRNLEKPLQK